MTTRAGASYYTGRSVTNSLESTDGLRDGLRGAVLANDHKSYTRLGKILGLGNKEAVKDWMNSQAFRPLFERLYKDWIEVQQDNAEATGTIRKRGPDLQAVVDAIDDPHAISELRYDAPILVDTSDFHEIDHYALCLLGLRRVNKSSAHGLFRGKTCSQEEMDQRLWQAILRATSDRTIERRNKGKPSTYESRYGESPTNDSQGSGSKTPPATNNGQGSGSKTPPAIAPQDNGNEKGKGVPDNLDHPPPDEHIAGLGKEVESSKGIKDNNEMLMKRNFERLKATQNLLNPMDLSTEYGRYFTVHTALEYSHQPLEIQRLVENRVLTIGEGGNQNALSAESRSWLNELESSMHGNRVPMRVITSDDTDRVSRMEAHLDNPLYQRMDYKGACEALGITDLQNPHLPGMPVTAILKSWQVTGVKALVDFEADPSLLACVLADSTGLGKTLEILAFLVFRYNRRQEEVNAYNTWKAARDTAIRNGDVVPPEPNDPGPARPSLLLVPSGLIHQWVAAFAHFATIFRLLLYYGDTKVSSIKAHKKIVGFLDKKHKIFNGMEENSLVVVISTIETLSHRHGPNAQMSYRMKSMGFSEHAATSYMTELDMSWKGCLHDQFDLVCVDEAHVIKNPEASVNTTLIWLGASFYVLATAIPLPNSVRDCAGYVLLMTGGYDPWENNEEWEIASDCNPYEFEEDDPKSALIFSEHALETFITGPNVNTQKAGFYLAKIWKRAMVRRTYASPDPADPTKRVSDSLPKLYNRRVLVRLTKREQEMYNKLSKEPLQKIARFVGEGKVVWNRKYARQLILLSTWLGFSYLSDKVMADSIAMWKSYDDMLYRWIKIVHQGEEDALGEALFEVPEPDNAVGILSAVCRDSAKVRHALRIIIELVLVAKRKVVIWCALPANQLLLHGILQLLNISHCTYSAELTSDARSELVNNFTTKPNEYMVFIASYAVAGVGLNLQNLSHHAIDFDAPENRGQRDQAIGRQRRIGQPETVERFEMSVVDTFHDRITSNAIMKALVGGTAELTTPAKKVSYAPPDKDLEVVFTIGRWYMVDGVLIQGPDPRVDDLPASDILSPTELVEAILNGQVKTDEEMPCNWEWVTEEPGAEFTPMDFEID